VNALLTPEQVEDRLRRTLAARAGDVPPGDGDLDLDRGAGELQLIPGDGRPRPRRARVVLAAAAAVVVTAAAAGAVVLAGGEDTTLAPAGQVDPPPTEPPPTTTVPPPPTTDPGQIPDPPVTGPTAPGTSVPEIDPDSPYAQSGGRLPTLVAGYRQIGQPLSQEIWLYLTWYPSPAMAREPVPGYAREDLTVAETEAVLETANDGPGMTAWLFYADGTLGVHSGGISRDEVLAVAASVRRTAGTTRFASTPPAGWEINPE